MEIVLILDNIRSMYNVGSIFRTSDAFGVREIVCSGYTPTPAHPELAKTGLGAESSVKWRSESVPDAVARLRSEGYMVLALETGGATIAAMPTNTKVALILGNEVEGIASEHLSIADRTVSIPMLGTKESLNVSVATGIALFALTHV